MSALASPPAPSSAPSLSSYAHTYSLPLSPSPLSVSLLPLLLPAPPQNPSLPPSTCLLLASNLSSLSHLLLSLSRCSLRALPPDPFPALAAAASGSGNPERSRGDFSKPPVPADEHPYVLVHFHAGPLPPAPPPVPSAAAAAFDGEFFSPPGDPGKQARLAKLYKISPAELATGLDQAVINRCMSKDLVS